MTVIYAEKPDMGIKIAAALDAIHLSDGTNVSFNNINKYEDAIKKQAKDNGFFEIDFYNEETYVTWGYGHMVGLKQAEDYNSDYKDWNKLPLPYIPESYDLKITTKYLTQFNCLKQLFKKSDLIICATDDDREGDLIFDYIYTYINCKTPYKRALFNKQSQEEFKKAFKEENLIDSDERSCIIAAGRARSDGDYVVGTGPTVAMTLKYNSESVLSVGRVQTTVLNMIVKREKEILNFKAQDYWVIKTLFMAQDGSEYSGIHTLKRFNNHNEATQKIEKLKSITEGKIKNIEVKRQIVSKPNLYSMPTLQMEANKKYGFSLDKTLKIAQSLYDKGYLTYPRTDSLYLTEDMVPEVDEIITALKNSKYSELIPQDIEDYNNKHYFDNSKVQSHYAIIPTRLIPGELPYNEEKIYSLVVNSVLTMLYPKAIIEKTILTTVIDDEEFISTGSTVVDIGFMRITGLPKEEYLPILKQNDSVKIKDILLEKKQTEPPKRYTGGTLLNAMINCGKTLEDEELRLIMSKGPDGKPRGVGRPSSQAKIVKTLEDRGYTEVKGKTIYPTKKGVMMIESFPVEDLKSPEMTAKWEKRLDNIESGEDTYEDFMYDLENSVRRWTKEIMETKANEKFEKVNKGKNSLKCPVCKRVLKKCSWGYGCIGYNDQENKCDFAIRNEIAKKKIPDKQIENLIIKGETSLIKGFTSKNGKKFDASLKLNRKEKTIEFQFPDTTPKETALECPLCGKILKKMTWGFGCSGYSDGCKFSIGTILGKKLNEKQAKELLDGEIVFIEGFKSKNGNKFDAGLELCMEEGEDYGKIKFVFDE